MVAAIRELLKLHDDNQSMLAPKLLIKQPTLSALLGGRHQAGWGLARRVAALSGTDVDVLTGGRAAEPRTTYDDLIPARGVALAPFDSATDPHMRAAVQDLRATSYGEGGANWTVERWTRELLRLADEKRLDTLDPSRIQAQKDRAAETIETEDRSEQDALMEQAHRIAREKNETPKTEPKRRAKRK